MNIPKLHHYVPRSYLRGFADSSSRPTRDLVWVYDKQTGRISAHHPKAVGAITDYYSRVRAGGSKDVRVEQEVLAPVDGVGAELIKRIERKPMTDEDREILALYAATMMLRVPNFRDNYKRGDEEVFRFQVEAITSDSEVFEQFTRELEATTDFRAGGAYEELRADLIQSLPGLRFDEESSIRGLRHLEMVFGVLIRMRWRKVKTKGSGRLVTSDNPVAVFHPGDGKRGSYGLGLELADTQVTFPLTKTMAVVGAWHESPALSAEEVNERAIIVAERFVFGPRKSAEIARLVRKHAASAPRMKIGTSMSRRATGEIELAIEASGVQELRPCVCLDEPT